MKLIDYSKVKIDNGFWKVKQDMVRNVTIPAVYDRFTETHRFEALACKWRKGEPNVPHVFWDSDVAKWIEGVAYILAFRRDEGLEKIVDDAVEQIVKNSDEHGYFNSHFLVTEQEKRFTNRDCHELYCAGHLMEAAVAYYEATGKDAFLKAMCKYADYIEKVFKTKNTAAFCTPGHPELELALMRLYKATGEKRYAELAKYFIDVHGNNDKDTFEDWRTAAYTMDEPLRDVTEPRGHAVRALYLLCGMADVAIEYGDEELKNACRRCFESIITKRMYITGGVGSTELGEAFTIDYHLPNRTAYSETCAAIALAMFCLRMQKIDNDPRYADTVERVIFNGILSGVSMYGKNFFYVNPLEIDLDFNDVNPATVDKEKYPITRRPEYFTCSCCPPNIVRFISSVNGYIFGEDDDTVFVNQFISSEMTDADTFVRLSTEYPVNGNINIHCRTDRKYLAVRLPGWCEHFTADSQYTLGNGYIIFNIDGECDVNICFDMPITLVEANRRVHENAGRVAVTRGPIVYCAESCDNPVDLKAIRLCEAEEFTLTDCEFLVPGIRTTAYVDSESKALYRKLRRDLESVELKLIPYYAFANREKASMLVWFLHN